MTGAETQESHCFLPPPPISGVLGKTASSVSLHNESSANRLRSLKESFQERVS